MNVARGREDTSMRISSTLARNVGMANAIQRLFDEPSERAGKKEGSWTEKRGGESDENN